MDKWFSAFNYSCCALSKEVQKKVGILKLLIRVME